MRSKRSQTRKAMYNVVPLIQPSKQGTTMGTESVPVTAKGREQERKMLPEKGQYERFFFFKELVTMHLSKPMELQRRRKWQPTPVSLPGKSHGREPGRLQSMGSQSQTRLSD